MAITRENAVAALKTKKNPSVTIKVGAGVIILEMPNRVEKERWVMPSLTIDEPPSYVFESIPVEIGDDNPELIPEFLKKTVALAREQKAQAVLLKARPEQEAAVKKQGFVTVKASDLKKKFHGAFRANDRRKTKPYIYQLKK